MPDKKSRVLPDLLPPSKDGRAAFRDYFRPDGTPLRMAGPENRTIAFDARNEGAYSVFFRARALEDLVPGRPAQHYPVIKDTLENPDEIWFEAGAPRNTEFFITRYESVVFLVKCRATYPPDVQVEPRLTGYFPKDQDVSTIRILKNAHRIWPVASLAAQATELACSWRVAVCFGAAEERIEHESWKRRFRQLELEWNVRIVEEFCPSLAFPAGTFNYWILDTNTAPKHGDYDHGWEGAARTARATLVVANAASDLAVKLRDGKKLQLTVAHR